jgi:hypothetical protein
MKRMDLSLLEGTPCGCWLEDCGKAVNGALTVEDSSEAFTGLSSALS